MSSPCFHHPFSGNSVVVGGASPEAAPLGRRVARFGARRRRWRRLEGRRGGQALILAVFIMLFAALLSSTFLVLVASNTQTVGRSIDKTAARRAADEGAQRARVLMAASSNADFWQPEAEPSLFNSATLKPTDLPPDANDATYDQYWTPLDKAMGWALTLKYQSADVAGRLQELQKFKESGGRVFVKVPDPRASHQPTRYLIESRLLRDNMDEVTDGGDKKFMLRVTSIGLSPQNPEVWARQVLYKSTNFNGATFSYAHFVSNYDFGKDGGKGGFASTRLSADVPTGTTTIALTALDTFSANVFAPGQALMLSDGVGDPFTSLIARRDGVSVTLKTATPRAFAAANTTAALAATLTSGLDALNDTGTATALSPNAFNQKTLAPQHFEVNAGAGAANDASNAAGTLYGNGSFYNLGLKVGERAEFKARPPHARSWGTYSTYSGQNALTVTGPLDRSGANLSLYNVLNSAPGAANGAMTPPALEAAQNKYFRLSLSPGGAMQVDKYLPEVDPLVAPRPVTPAVVDIAQYQARAQNGGQFIANAGDFEKVNGVALSDPQLQRLWQRKSFAASNGNINYTGGTGAIGAGTSGMRLSWPRPGVDSYAFPMSAGSLEQRGVRGWISPWEFLPRGALLELRDNQLYLTLDALGDAGAIDPAKQLASGQYSGPLPVPANGIICASGNLRVRGNWNGRALTIVSGHNIYIEGALTSDAPGKIALLAKHNVTLNPTQFLARPDGLTDRSLAATPVAIAAQGNGSVTLAPGNSGRFKIGDKIALTNSNSWGKVTKISGDTLTFAGNLGQSGPNAQLRQMTDPAVVMVDASGKVVTDASAVSYAYALGKNSDNLYRIALNDGAGASVGLRQAAERVELTLASLSKKDKIEVRIKADHNGNGQVDYNGSQSDPKKPEMWMWGTIDKKAEEKKGAFLYNLHNLTEGVGTGHALAGEGDGKATLSQLQQQLLLAREHEDDTVSPWALTLPASSAPVNPYGAVPMRRLAQFEVTGAPKGSQFKLPLTTSVGLFWDDPALAGNATPALFYGSFWGPVATESQQNRPEALDMVKAEYYGKTPQWRAMIPQANAGASALFSLQRDVAGDPDALLPRSYIAGWHLEGGNGTTGAPVYSPRIQATIYAQSGSWFVIPMPAQAIDDPTNPQAGRWRRSFYKVAVEGDIAQGFTPSAGEDYDNESDPDGQSVGATKRWLDSLAYPTALGTGGAAGNWATISYAARPLPLNHDLALPTTANVLYTFVE